MIKRHELFVEVKVVWAVDLQPCAHLTELGLIFDGFFLYSKEAKSFFKTQLSLKVKRHEDARVIIA